MSPSQPIYGGTWMPWETLQAASPQLDSFLGSWGGDDRGRGFMSQGRLQDEIQRQHSISESPALHLHPTREEESLRQDCSLSGEGFAPQITAPRSQGLWGRRGGGRPGFPKRGPLHPGAGRLSGPDPLPGVAAAASETAVAIRTPPILPVPPS